MIETDTQTAPVLIDGAMSVYEAAEIRDTLGRAFREAGETGVTLDLSAVESCDAAGVQIICAARRTAREAGTPFRVTATSEAVNRALRSAGLTLSEMI
jgi:anti-sigma B factor antagonist